MASASIVAGIDFSECGKAALAAATDLAVDLDAPLILVHAFSPERYAPALMGQAGLELMRDAHQKQSQSEAIDFTENWASWAREQGAEVHTVAEDGDPKELLVAQAKQSGARLLVVGTHGHRGVKHFILGSVAEGVIRSSPVPVLVVPLRRKK